MNRRKCEGRATYPGLVLYSRVDAKTDGCGIGPGVQADHCIAVTNASTLTYEIRCQSTCDKDYLKYFDADPAEPNVWKTKFTAPWRWDDAARKSEDLTPIVAANPVRTIADREIEVEIVCEAANYSPVGPFQIPLQVDIEGA